jgi:hypothetical protein
MVLELPDAEEEGTTSFQMPGTTPPASCTMVQ